MTEKYEFPKKLKTTFLAISVIGLVLMLLGIANFKSGDSHGSDSHGGHASIELASSDRNVVLDEHSSDHGHGHKLESHKHVTFKTQLGLVIMVGFVMFLLVSIFGVFFVSLSYPAKAGYMVATRRILETYFYYIPVVLITGLVFYFGFYKEVYEWVYNTKDELINGKRAFLNGGMLLFTVVFLPIISFLMGMWYRKNGKAEESMTDPAYPLHFKAAKVATSFLPVFMIGLLLTSWVLIMSVDPTWYSTIYWVYVFAGMFVMGATITGMIISYMKENGFLKKVTQEHMHDYGKWMFAISVFWAYIWISQFLLIWYANIPEETIYFQQRFDWGYKGLFLLNLVINFVFPFLVLMMRNSKRNWSSIRKVGVVLLFGRFLDIYLLLAPGIVGDQGGFGLFLAALGMVMVHAGLFLYVVFHNISKENLYPTGHPYLEESFHYDTGV